jgi:hypothetical protein
MLVKDMLLPAALCGADEVRTRAAEEASEETGRPQGRGAVLLTVLSRERGWGEDKGA